MTAHRIIAGLLLACAAIGAGAQGTARVNLVFVLDGLRPDSINATDSPNLFRLRSEGVNFLNSHSVFPTVTGVNSAALGTGMYPEHNGIMSNSNYIPAVNPVAAFTNDSMKLLLKLDEATPGKVLLAPTLAEYLAASGKKFVAVSSGSNGRAFLLTPKVLTGTGYLVHADPGGEVRQAYPEQFAAEIAKRFGSPPKKGGAADSHSSSVDWVMDVLGKYVLPEMQPQVVYTWMTEPDHTQHAHGIGAADTVAAIRNDDRLLGILLSRLDAMGVGGKVNIMVVSDHGFSQINYGVNLKQALVGAGLMAAEDSDDLVIASSGESVLLHVKHRDTVKIDRIAAFLKQQSWCGVLFTAADPAKPGFAGRVPGTFSIDLIHLGGNERSPDLVLTFPWSSAANANGMPGMDMTLVGGATGPIDGARSNHGSMSPWTVRNTMLAWGPDFKRGVTLRTPSSNVDIAPTLLFLVGDDHAVGLDGRVLVEALVNGPDPEKIPVNVQTLRVKDGKFVSFIQITETEGKRYIDKSWRE